MNCHITRFNHPDQNWLDAVLMLRRELIDNASPEPFASFVKERLEDENMLLVIAWMGDVPVGGWPLTWPSIPSCPSGHAPDM